MVNLKNTTLAALLITTVTSATAEEQQAIPTPGRYQAISIPTGNRIGAVAGLMPKVLILDTQEGHIWTWSENETVYDGGPNPKLGTIMVYQGQVRPGKTMGDIIEKSFR